MNNSHGFSTLFTTIIVGAVFLATMLVHSNFVFAFLAFQTQTHHQSRLEQRGLQCTTLAALLTTEEQISRCTIEYKNNTPVSATDTSADTIYKIKLTEDHVSILPP